MNIAKILAELKAERRRLDSAIQALQALTNSSLPRIQTARRVSGKRKAPAVRGASSAQMASGNLLMFPGRRNRKKSAAKKGLSGGGSQA